MDCSMPEMDGFDACREIRSRMGSEAPPILAMTASASPENRKLCVQAGMEDCLVKPVTGEHLKQALARWAKDSGAPDATVVETGR
jgi:CheY-like chemotaxis protein